jgi:hypothetical protein
MDGRLMHAPWPSARESRWCTSTMVREGLGEGVLSSRLTPQSSIPQRVQLVPTAHMECT